MAPVTSNQTTAAIDKLFAANLRAERARAHISQHDLAVAMRAAGHDWFTQTVSTVERGRRRIVANELPALAAALGTTVAVLVAPYE